VSVTSTVNLLFGSKYLAPKTGIIMNNQENGFSSHFNGLNCTKPILHVYVGKLDHLIRSGLIGLLDFLVMNTTSAMHRAAISYCSF